MIRPRACSCASNPTVFNSDPDGFLGDLFAWMKLESTTFSQRQNNENMQDLQVQRRSSQ